MFQNGGQTEKGTDDRQLGATHSSGAKAPQTKAWLKPYSNETGTEIRQDSPTDYAKLQSMVENNQVIWDLVNVSNDFGLESTAKLLEPLDSSLFDKEPILEGYASKYRVACMLYANTLAYNTEQFDGTPSTWADLFDPQNFPGQRGFRKSPSETLEMALFPPS